MTMNIIRIMALAANGRGVYIKDAAEVEVTTGRFTENEQKHRFPTRNEAVRFACAEARRTNGQIEDYTTENAVAFAFQNDKPGFWWAGRLDEDGVGSAWSFTPLVDAPEPARSAATAVLALEAA